LSVLGDIEFHPWQCIAELIDNAFDDFLRQPSDQRPDQPSVWVSLPGRGSTPRDAEVWVRDNGRGMTLPQLRSALRAGWSSNDRFGHLGRFLTPNEPTAGAQPGRMDCRRRSLPLLHRTNAMTSFDPTRLPERTLSKSIEGPDGQAAVKIEALPITSGQRITLTFETVGPRWRQGVFLATAGQLVATGTSSSSLVLWSDSAPARSVIDVADTDVRLVLYNIWDSGRGRGPFESQSATSGMFVETLADRSHRYSCTDIGVEPDFSRLIFRVSIE